MMACSVAKWKKWKQLPLCDAHPSTSGGPGAPRPSRRPPYLNSYNNNNSNSNHSDDNRNNNSSNDSISSTSTSSPVLSPASTSPPPLSSASSASSPLHTAAAATTATTSPLERVAVVTMPPPKKPKNGPTREEQFLSGEELRSLSQQSRRDRGSDEGDTSSMPELQRVETSPSPGSRHAPAGSPSSPGSVPDPVGSDGDGGSSTSGRVSSSPRSAGAEESQHRLHRWTDSSGEERVRKLPATTSSPRGIRRSNSGGVAYDRKLSIDADRPVLNPKRESPLREEPTQMAHPAPLPPPQPPLHRPRHPSGATPGYPALGDIDVLPHAGAASASSGHGRLIERLFTERLPGEVPRSAFREHHRFPGWPPGAPSQPPHPPVPPPPQVYNSDPRSPSLVGYKLTTSSAFPPLTGGQQSPWQLTLDPQAAARRLSLRPPSVGGGIEFQGLHSAAAAAAAVNFNVQQQQLSQHPHGRSILTSLFTSNVGAAAEQLSSPPGADEVFMQQQLRASSPPPGRRAPHQHSPSTPTTTTCPSPSSPYLSNVMRPTGLRVAPGPRHGGTGPGGHRTESAPVYLHPAFQLLPHSPSTSSIRKNNSTSALLAKSPTSPGPPPLPQTLPRNITAAAEATAFSPAPRLISRPSPFGSSASNDDACNTTSLSATHGSNGNGISLNNNSRSTNKSSTEAYSVGSLLSATCTSGNTPTISGSYISRAHEVGPLGLDLSMKNNRSNETGSSQYSYINTTSSRFDLPPYSRGSLSPMRRSNSVSSPSPRQAGSSPPRIRSNTLHADNVGEGSLSNLRYYHVNRTSPSAASPGVRTATSPPHTPERRGGTFSHPSSGSSSPASSRSRRPVSLLTKLMEKPPNELAKLVEQRAAGIHGAAATTSSGAPAASLPATSPANSEDSNTSINVTSPVGPVAAAAVAPLNHSQGSMSPPTVPPPPPQSVMMRLMSAAPSTSPNPAALGATVATTSPQPPPPPPPPPPQQTPQQPQRTSELAGLLTQPMFTTTSASTSFASSLPVPSTSPSSISSSLALSSSALASALLAVKKEEGAPLSSSSSSSSTSSQSVPYAMITCKTEDTRRSSLDADSREPSDCKSPKEEGRMVSPSSCLPVLPMGSGGGGGSGEGGSSSSTPSSVAHLQAATSTTPEAGAGPSLPPPPPPHNFLLDPHASGMGVGAGPGAMGTSPPSMMKQEVGTGAVPGSSMQAKLCQVCSDNASGFHYGVWSCEGCKAFFKRSIQGPVDYICPATNTCTIDKHRRKSCQACRLRKCYEVGMNKGSQRKERKNSSTPGAVLKANKRCRADSTDTTVNSTNNGGASSSKIAKRSRSASILEALQKADMPMFESNHNHSEPATRVHLLNTLIQLADRELVYLINWAKNVPGYTCLTLSDQVHLIECCWLELLLLNCAFRSMEHEGRTLVFASDFRLERQHWAVTGMGDVLEQVSAVSEQMVLYGLNKEELLLLQATVLVNAEVRRMDSFEKIHEMRQLILDVFMEVASRHQGYGSWRHAPSILLLLTHIRQAGERGITYFQRLKMEGTVTFCDLLTEMLDAHRSSGERRRQQLQQQQQQPHHPALHHHPHHQHHQQQQHPGLQQQQHPLSGGPSQQQQQQQQPHHQSQSGAGPQPSTQHHHQHHPQHQHQPPQQGLHASQHLHQPHPRHPMAPE